MKNKTLASLILATGIGLMGCNHQNINLEIGQVTTNYFIATLTSLELKKGNGNIIRYNLDNSERKVLSVTIRNEKDDITLDSPEFLKEAQKEYEVILSQIEEKGIKYLR